jgi:hypothetical protein
MPFKKCLDFSAFGAIPSLTTLCIERSLIITNWGFFHLLYYGWYLDCPPNYTFVLKRSKRGKLDPRFLEKLASSQGNKKEDIEKRKKNVEVLGIPKAMEVKAKMEQFELNVNVNVAKFQDSPNCDVQKEDSLGASKTRKGCVVDLLSHMRRRRRLV